MIDSSDVESEHNIASPPSPGQNNESVLRKPIPDNLKVTVVQHGPERYKIKGISLLRGVGKSFSK